MKNLPRYLRIVAACLLASFAVDAVRVAVGYNDMVTAVPLPYFLLLDVLLFLLPAALLLLAALLIRNRYNRKP